MENTESVTRKSSSLDNVNLQQENKTQWKSFSLQRGAAPPTEEEAAHAEQVIAMKSSRAEHVGGAGHGEQEDMYGRCTNMRLTSFTDKGAAVPRDPRLIDLSQSAASTGNLGHPPLTSHPPLPHTSAFNTLPAHMSGQQPGHAPQPHPQPHHPHNTLPARVGEAAPRNLHFPPNHLPSGRHFKPFDHKRINPMAEIQENPYEQQANNGYGGQYGGPENGGTYIVHHNNHIPHMPQELRHTNYGPTNKPGLMHPQVLQHRDNGH